MKIDPAIKKDLEKRLKEDLATKKSQVTIVSAYKLNPKDAEEIFKKFPSIKKSNIKYKIDESIIAGYVIKVGSRVVDISVKGQLESFKNLII